MIFDKLDKLEREMADHRARIAALEQQAAQSEHKHKKSKLLPSTDLD
jgi:hypothetical protein